jgi:threonine dehydrogenase-like Zn-dependent dehydrogenase
MRRLVAQGGMAVIREEPEPRLRRGEVLVRTEYSVMSPGTERTVIDATAIPGAESHEYPEPRQQWRKVRTSGATSPELLPRAPGTGFASIGYSLAGRVLEVAPDIHDIHPGDYVACAGSQCAFHAECVAVPRNLTVAVPEGVPGEHAAHVTLGAIAIEALRRTGCTVGETILIVGAGLLGNLLTQLAHAAGIYTIVADINPTRLQLLNAEGILRRLPALDEAGIQAVHDATDGFGADAAIIAVTTTSNEVINGAFDALRVGGRIVALGQFGMDLDRQKWFGAQAVLVTSVAYGPGRYDPIYEENNIDLPINVMRWTENRNMALFIRLLAERRILMDNIPSLRVPLETADATYRAIGGNAATLTAVFTYGASREEA